MLDVFIRTDQTFEAGRFASGTGGDHAKRVDENCISEIAMRYDP